MLYNINASYIYISLWTRYFMFLFRDVFYNDSWNFFHVTHKVQSNLMLLLVFCVAKRHASWPVAFPCALATVCRSLKSLYGSPRIRRFNWNVSYLFIYLFFHPFLSKFFFSVCPFRPQLTSTPSSTIIITYTLSVDLSFFPFVYATII